MGAARESLIFDQLYDATGHHVPSVMWEAFEYAAYIDSLAQELNRLTAKIDIAISAAKGSEYVDRKFVIDSLVAVYEHLLNTRAVRLCMRCYNAYELNTACRCAGRGWLPLLGCPDQRVQSAHRYRVKRAKEKLVTVADKAEAIFAFVRTGDYSKAAFQKLPRNIRKVARIAASGEAFRTRGSSIRRQYRSRPDRTQPPPATPPTSPENSPGA